LCPDGVTIHTVSASVNNSTHTFPTIFETEEKAALKKRRQPSVAGVGVGRRGLLMAAPGWRES
jgi:hypothetical protein